MALPLSSNNAKYGRYELPYHPDPPVNSTHHSHPVGSCLHRSDSRLFHGAGKFRRGSRFDSGKASNPLIYRFKFTTMTPPSASAPPRMPSSVGTSPSQKKPIRADMGETR